MRVEDVAPRTWLLVALAGWAVFAWLLAVAGMGRRVLPLDDDPSLQQPLPQLRPSPPERLGPFAQYAEIATRPLFSDDRRPKPFSLQPEGEEANANAFDYILTSVLLTPRLRLAIVQPGDGGDPIRIKLGESAEQAASWRLVSVEPRSAVFEGPEGQRTLELRSFDGTGGMPATPPASQPVAGATRAARPNMPVPAVPQAGARNAAGPAPRVASPAVNAPQPPQPAPGAAPTPTPSNSDATTITPEAQIEAIRKRIQDRREQLRREAQQSTPPNNP